MMPEFKLIKYGHEYCGPCKIIKPYVLEVIEILKDRVSFEDKDTYELSPEELLEKNIRGVPTLILEKDGVEVWRRVGLLSKESLLKEINQQITNE